jgi:predicted glycosyltransferase involved in capsule biosynthesis
MPWIPASSEDLFNYYPLSIFDFLISDEFGSSASKHALIIPILKKTKSILEAPIFFPVLFCSTLLLD